MNDPKQFLLRWSRRKAAASFRALETAATTQETATDGRAPLDEAAKPVVDLASLPSIEDITADTDLGVFLTPGLPLELTRSALRRAWSVDATIRDFVGPADYAWDFNAPDAMAGFGPLKMSDSLRNELAQMLFQAPKSTGEDAVGATEAQKMDHLSAAISEASLPRNDTLAASAQLPATSAVQVDDPEPAAVKSQSSETPSATGSGLRRRGGGALPA